VHVAELEGEVAEADENKNLRGEGGVEVFIFPPIISVKPVGLIVVDDEEVGSRIVLHKQSEELFECEL